MEDLFSNATSNAATQVDPKAAYEALVGEGKKYATPEALAASRIHADKFIEKLQQETQELRKELDQRLTVEQLMTKLNANQVSDDAGNRGHIPQPPHLEPNPQGVQLTEDAVAKMVQQELSRHQNATREQANTAVVVNELKKVYGENYVDAMQARLNELGISKEAAIQMAATMPKAYIELVGKKPTSSAPTVNQSPPRGQTTTFNVDSNIPKMSDFNKMRRENPREFFKPHIQNQIMQLAQQYGEQFTNR